VTPVRIFHGDVVLDGRSEDVSVGGLLVLAPQAFEQAELVRVRFALPSTGQVIEIGATARWVKAARVNGAVGLQFTALPADAHDVIERYVTMMGGE
jgi:hypothetical protein